MITEIEKAYLDAVETSINLLVPWYLMAAYAYYEEDNPIMSDQTFDKCAKKLLNNWEQIEHMHKHYLNKDMLYAGTYIGEYPSRVEHAVGALRGAYNDKQKR